MIMVSLIRRIRQIFGYLAGNFILKSELYKFGKNSRLGYPCHVESPQDVTVDENVNIRFGLSVINNKGEKVHIRKYTTLAPNVTIVTNNHIPVVGVPIFLLTSSHVNDKSTDIIIEEDCWVGTDVKLLAGSHLGRGCVIGAGAIVTKAIPPYAVVVGSPARIIGVRFSIDQIIQHEMVLYCENERLTKVYLELLFEKHYDGLKSLGCGGEVTEQDRMKIEYVKEKFGYIEQIM